MWIKEAFDRLGIAPTDEQRQVKKAYAQLVKTCHPEEDPEGWKMLHEAYETALAYARRQTPLKQAVDEQKESAESQGEEDDDTEKIFMAFDLIEKQQREKEIRDEAARRAELRLREQGEPRAEENTSPPFDPRDSRYVQPPKKKKFNRSMLFCAAVVILFGLYAFSRVGKPGSMSAGSAAKEMADYLNSKYETQQYERGDFTVKTITLRELKDNSNVLCGYYSALPDGAGTYVYLLIWETKNNEKVMVLYDSCQEEEITADLQKEICEKTGIKTGILRLSVGGNDYYERRFIESHPAYTTRYDGDLEAFFRAEEAVRSNCMAEDIHKTAGEILLRLNLNPGANPNGRCNFYYPDEAIATLSDRLTAENWSMSKKISQTLSDIEDRYKLQVMAAALPQSCYHALEEKGGDLWKLSVSSNDSFESPLTVPLIAGWYMNDTDDYVSTSGLMDDTTEMMDILNQAQEGALNQAQDGALNQTQEGASNQAEEGASNQAQEGVLNQTQEGALNQTQGEAQESSPGEASEKASEEGKEKPRNLHFVAAQKLSEGIYILPEYEKTKAVTAESYKLSQTYPQADKKTLAISCTGTEAESCVLVLDRKALHIPDQVTSVTRRNTSDSTGEEKTLQIVPYMENDVLNTMSAAADGEGFLFLHYEVEKAKEDADTYFIEIQ